MVMVTTVRIVTAEANYSLPLDRPFSLRNQQAFLIEQESARQIRSGRPMSFILPRPCFSEVDSSRVCGAPHGFTYLESSGNRQLSVSPLAGYEYRLRDEGVNAFEGGVMATGSSGPVSFYLDARMFAELHEDFRHASLDREFVERQDEEASGSLAYSSYSRYRANLNYDMAWGRLSAGRDAVHWGPGHYGNLVFHQEAVPFNQLTFTTRLGPLRVQTLYGQLTSSDPGTFPKDSINHSVYAHRYELAVGRNCIIGISEQLILFDREAPFAFLPVVPLYIMKAYAHEDHSNGNIAADVAYRWRSSVMVYSEFLIDDLQSPTALFDDFWADKWAWTAGLHYVIPPSDRGLDGGLVGEYSRVEPWVYTHYLPRTAQSANQGIPLGNPNGPNSQSLTAKPYLTWRRAWHASIPFSAVWKGRDPGSSIGDTMDERSKARKEFLKDVGDPDWKISPTVGCGLRYLSFDLEAGMGIDPGIRLRMAGNF